MPASILTFKWENRSLITFQGLYQMLKTTLTLIENLYVGFLIKAKKIILEDHIILVSLNNKIYET
jgi:hypothetical protein